MLTDSRLCRGLQGCLDSQAARQRLRPHAGKVLRVHAGPARVALRIDADGAPRPVHAAVWADAWVKVPLVRLAGCKATIESHGDSELLAAWAKVWEGVDLGPDALAELVGGPAAGSAAANAALGARRWRKDALARLEDSFRDWLEDGNDVLVRKEESRAAARQISEFARRVEALRQQLQRSPDGAGQEV